MPWTLSIHTYDILEAEHEIAKSTQRFLQTWTPGHELPGYRTMKEYVKRLNLPASNVILQIFGERCKRQPIIKSEDTNWIFFVHGGTIFLVPKISFSGMTQCLRLTCYTARVYTSSLCYSGSCSSYSSSWSRSWQWLWPCLVRQFMIFLAFFSRFLDHFICSNLLSSSSSFPWLFSWFLIASSRYVSLWEYQNFFVFVLVFSVTLYSLSPELSGLEPW